MTNDNALKILRWIVEKMNSFNVCFRTKLGYKLSGKFILIEKPIVSICFLTKKGYLVGEFINLFYEETSVSAKTPLGYLKKLIRKPYTFSIHVGNTEIMAWLNNAIAKKSPEELLIQCDLS